MALELPNLKGKTILIVDDDADVVAGLTAALSVTGATISSVGDGNAAVEACTASPPDLMLLDMMLPKRSGFLVLEKIKPAQPGAKRPAVIMITANQGTRHRDFAEGLGVDDYINKPFTVERLMKSIARIFPAKG